jgi:polyisoprenoid-binding protein YceI
MGVGARFIALGGWGVSGLGACGLTIKGNTRPVTFSVVRYGEFNDPMMGHRIGYSAESQINRKEFGLTFNMMLDGKWIVSDEVQIMIEGEFVEQKQ